MMIQALSPWLRRLKVSPVEQTIVCFPHAGGTANYFSPWARLMAPAIGLAAVQYPGRAERAGEQRIETMSLLADHAASAVAAIPGQIVLFGHSLGAAVAHEVAVRLRHTRNIRALVVSARCGPLDREHTVGHLLPDDELWNEIRQLNGTDAEIIVEDDLRRMLLPILRSDYRLAANYQPHTHRSLSIPIVACVGDADPEVTPEQMLSWRKATGAPFTLRIFPGGDHFYFRHAPDELTALLAGLFPEPQWPSMP